MWRAPAVVPAKSMAKGQRRSNRRSLSCWAVGLSTRQPPPRPRRSCLHLNGAGSCLACICGAHAHGRQRPTVQSSFPRTREPRSLSPAADILDSRFRGECPYTPSAPDRRGPRGGRCSHRPTGCLSCPCGTRAPRAFPLVLQQATTGLRPAAPRIDTARVAAGNRPRGPPPRLVRFPRARGLTPRLSRP